MSTSAIGAGRTSSSFAWWVFAAVCILSFVGFGLTVNTISIYWTPLSEDFGVSIADVSLMGTFAGIAGAIALGVASPLFEKFNLRVFLSIMVVLTAIAYFVSASAPDMTLIYVANIVMGVTKSVAIMLSVPILLGNWFEKRLGLVTGIAGAMTAVGGAVFSPIVGAVITDYGWRTAYLLTGIALLVLVLPCTAFLTKLRPTGNQRPYGFDPSAETLAQSVATGGVSARRAFRSLPFAMFLIVAVILQFAGSLVQHINTYLTLGGMSITVAAAIFSALLLGASVGKLLMGAAIDFLKPVPALAIFTVIALIGWGGLWLFSGELALTGASFAAGMGQAINLVGVVVFIRNAFGGREYSKILGPILMTSSLANAGGIYVEGLLFDATGSYALSFAINLAIFVVAFALLVVALRAGTRMREQSAVDEPVEEEPVSVVAEASR